VADKTKVGVVGCGAICGAYVPTMKNSPYLDVVACSDLIIERAQAKADEFEIPKACTTEELLADPDVEIVVNLTIPIAHASVAQAAV